MTWSRAAYMASVTFSAGLITIACGTGTPWSTEDKENFTHYINSAEADIAAAELRNQGQPFVEISSEVVGEMLRLKRLALAEARLVSDDILEKALAGLSGPYRQLYQPSLELQIRNLEIGDIAAEVEGSRLHDQWVNWITPRQLQIRVPK